MSTGIGIGIAGQVFQTKAGVGIGPDADCIDSCSVNFANVSGGTQTQWLTGAQGTAVTFGAGGIGDFSISFWIYPTNISTGTNMRIFYFGATTTPASTGLVQMHINSTGTQLIATAKVDDQIQDQSSAFGLIQDKWTHITWTVARTAAPPIVGKWYVDGVFVGNTDTDGFDPATNVLTTPTTGPFYFGRTTGVSQMFEGNLDDFTIWDRALTAAEIIEIMIVSLSPTVCMNTLSFYDDLTHWWEMGDPQGDVSYPIIPDAIGTIDMEMKGMSASNIDCSSSPADEYTYIPDLNFQAALIAAPYSVTFPIPNYCLTSDINTLTYLLVSNDSIADLTGIEDFIALTQLNCDQNLLTTLDVSANTALTTLHCYLNPLGSLDVSTNTALTDLRCYNNNLTSLDVSNNTALTNLECSYNDIATLNLSANTALSTVQCYYNQFTSLEVSGATALTELYCYFNQLTSLDVSTNIALDVLWCSNNQLTSIDVSNNTALTDLRCQSNQLTSLDVSTNTALIQLHCNSNLIAILNVSSNTALQALSCQDNNLHSLDVRNGNNPAISTANFNATNNTNLICIEVDNVAWSDLNWTNIDAGASFSLLCLMTYIPDFYFRQKLNLVYGVIFPLTEYAWTSDVVGITNLLLTGGHTIYNVTGIEDFAALQVFNCSYQSITTLDLSYNTNLTSVTCWANQITYLDVSNSPGLITLDFQWNQVTSIDISNNPALKWFMAYENLLTTLDATNNPLIVTLNCNKNQLTSINLMATNTVMNSLHLYGNNFTNLDVINHTALTVLNVRDNLLTSINVSGCTALWSFDVSNYEFDTGNALTSIDTTTLTALTWFHCYKNALTSLDVSANSVLLNLGCSDNQLTSLDVSSNTALDTLWCGNIWPGAAYSNNQLGALDLSNNTALLGVQCENAGLTSLDIRNGNNNAISTGNFIATTNSFSCISVSDVGYTSTNWTNVDAGVTFSLSFPCP